MRSLEISLSGVKFVKFCITVRTAGRLEADIVLRHGAYPFIFVLLNP
jgi:hypothetical protein